MVDRLENKSKNAHLLWKKTKSFRHEYNNIVYNYMDILSDLSSTFETCIEILFIFGLSSVKAKPA